MKYLVHHNDEDRKIRVVERLSDGSRFYFESGALYTQVDAEGHNLLEYIAAMDRVLGVAGDVLLLGTAGGALATLLSRRGATVTAVDNMATAFEVARHWFHMPDEVECVLGDALDFLRTTPRQWDAIAVDVFHGAEIPKSMLTTEIGDLLAHALRPGGSIVWNVADSPESWPTQWIAKALKLAGLSPALMSVMDGGVGNTLVVCRNRRGPNSQRLGGATAQVHRLSGTRPSSHTGASFPPKVSADLTAKFSTQSGSYTAAAK
jgi:spermidine synthase